MLNAQVALPSTLEINLQYPRLNRFPWVTWSNKPMTLTSTTRVEALSRLPTPRICIKHSPVLIKISHLRHGGQYGNLVQDSHALFNMCETAEIYDVFDNRLNRDRGNHRARALPQLPPRISNLAMGHLNLYFGDVENTVLSYRWGNRKTLPARHLREAR